MPFRVCVAPQLHGPAGLGASALQLCGFRDCVQGLLEYVLESALESLLESVLEPVLESSLESVLESALEFSMESPTKENNRKQEICPTPIHPPHREKP